MSQDKNPILSFFEDAWSLIAGFGITLKYSLKRPSTVQYPREKRPLPKGIKGPIRFVTFKETQSHDCIACSLCQKICPSDCFEIKGGKMADGKRRPYYFTLNYSTCSLCSLCVEICPTKTLEHSDDIEWSALNRKEFVMDFIKDTADMRKRQGLETSAPVPTSSQAAPPPNFLAPPPPKPAVPPQAKPPAPPANPQTPAADA